MRRHKLSSIGFLKIYRLIITQSVNQWKTNTFRCHEMIHFDAIKILSSMPCDSTTKPIRTVLLEDVYIKDH